MERHTLAHKFHCILILNRNLNLWAAFHLESGGMKNKKDELLKDKSKSTIKITYYPCCDFALRSSYGVIIARKTIWLRKLTLVLNLNRYGYDKHQAFLLSRIFSILRKDETNNHLRTVKTPYERINNFPKLMTSKRLRDAYVSFFQPNHRI